MVASSRLPKSASWGDFDEILRRRNADSPRMSWMTGFAPRGGRRWTTFCWTTDLLIYRYLRPSAVREMLEQHRTGHDDNHKILFSLVVFEEWLRGQGFGRSCRRFPARSIFGVSHSGRSRYRCPFRTLGTILVLSGYQTAANHHSQQVVGFESDRVAPDCSTTINSRDCQMSVESANRTWSN